MAESTKPSTAQVGDGLPSFVRVTGLHHWNRYAAVNDEFVSMHMDDDAARTVGFSAAFGMGNLQWAYLHNLLRNWLGEEGRILRLSCQFRATNTKDSTVSARGVVSAVREEDGKRLIDLEVWTEDDDGNKLAPGNATVVLNG